MKVPVEYIVQVGLWRAINKCGKCFRKMDIKNYTIQLCSSCRRNHLNNIMENTSGKSKLALKIASMKKVDIEKFANDATGEEVKG